MRILLTGGTGLIGRELGKALVRKGHSLVVLTREPEKSKLKTPYPHTPIRWDGESGPLDKVYFDGIDGIIHLAGIGIAEKRWSTKFKFRLEDSRVTATNNLLRNAPKNLKFFIGSSAIGYYGESDMPLNEDSPAADHFFGVLCKKWEQKAYEHLDPSEVQIAHVRTGVVLSPEGGALAQMLPPLRSGLGGPLGNGKQIMSWIDIEDIVGIYLHILENKLSGPFNGVAPKPVSNKLLTKTIGQIICRPVFSPVPKISLRIVLGEVTKYLVMSQNISSQKIENAGYKFKFPDIDLSLRKNIPKLKLGESRYISEQYVYEPIDKVFPFFSNANNLEKITPASFKFKVLSKSTEQIQVGTLINYKLKIDGIIPARWQTLISDWNPPYQFADLQNKGPFNKWHHTHKFEVLGDGVLMTDTVDYRLPLGLLGWLVAGWKVNMDIKKIFNYRSKVLDQIFKK